MTVGKQISEPTLKNEFNIFCDSCLRPYIDQSNEYIGGAILSDDALSFERIFPG